MNGHDAQASRQGITMDKTKVSDAMKPDLPGAHTHSDSLVLGNINPCQGLGYGGDGMDGPIREDLTLQGVRELAEGIEKCKTNLLYESDCGFDSGLNQAITLIHQIFGEDK